MLQKAFKACNSPNWLLLLTVVKYCIEKCRYLCTDPGCKKSCCYTLLFWLEQNLFYTFGVRITKVSMILPEIEFMSLVVMRTKSLRCHATNLDSHANKRPYCCALTAVSDYRVPLWLDRQRSWSSLGQPMFTCVTDCPPWLPFWLDASWLTQPRSGDYQQTHWLVIQGRNWLINSGVARIFLTKWS